jgi:hypothetical protein
VAGIQPLATRMGGDVVYTVVVTLDEQPPDVRWDTSADVEIAAGEQ